MDSTDRPVDPPPAFRAEPDSLLGGSPAPEVRPLGDTPAPQIRPLNVVAFMIFVGLMAGFFASGSVVIAFLLTLFFIAVAAVAVSSILRKKILGVVAFMIFVGVVAGFFASGSAVAVPLILFFIAFAAFTVSSILSKKILGVAADRGQFRILLTIVIDGMSLIFFLFSAGFLLAILVNIGAIRPV